MIASPVVKVTNRDMLIICTSRAKNTTCCNRLSRLPDLPGEAEGEHVAVRPDSRILEEVPSAPEVASPLKDLVVGPTEADIIEGEKCQELCTSTQTDPTWHVSEYGRQHPSH